MPQEVGAFSVLRLQGVSKFKTTHSVTVLMENQYNQVLFATSADLPHDGDVGFAAGCIFIVTGSGIAYSNVGSATSANFDKISGT